MRATLLSLYLLAWVAQAEQPGQIVEVPAVCQSADAAVALAHAVESGDELATLSAAGPGGCLLLLETEVPAYLLDHVAGPHGTSAAWWSVWRARVGRALGFVVVRDRAL